MYVQLIAAPVQFIRARDGRVAQNQQIALTANNFRTFGSRCFSRYNNDNGYRQPRSAVVGQCVVHRRLKNDYHKCPGG